MIGLAGFGYQFNSMRDSTGKVAGAFTDFSNDLSALRGMGLLASFFPALRHLPFPSGVADNYNKVIMKRVCLQMVTEKKAEAEKIGSEGADLGKDLISIMVRANMQDNLVDRLDNDRLLAGELIAIRLSPL
ncbi:hypothetical protein FRB95_007062 [Tulasnella sp. JGI-2019a]|nr:hypothetical protein FRB95_007062 [Tulasnella sp. JGI-2019a]